VAASSLRRIGFDKGPDERGQGFHRVDAGIDAVQLTVRITSVIGDPGGPLGPLKR
jgi:hypothetical protein